MRSGSARTLGTRVPWLAAVLAALAVIAILLVAAVVVAPDASGTPWWRVAYVAAEAAATALIGIRVLSRSRASGRAAWIWIGAGLTVLTLRDAVENGGPLAGSLHGSTASQVLFLAFFVCVFVGLGLTVRARATRTRAALWLDGVIAVLGLLAVVSFVASTLNGDGAGGWSIELFYPAAPLLFVAVLIGALTLADRRPSPTWWLLAGGALLMTVANIALDVSIANGATTALTAISALWPLALLLFANAAWIPRDSTDRPDTAARGIVFAPVVFSTGALAVQLANELGVNSAAAEYFALSTLGVAILRLIISVGEAERLRVRERQLTATLEVARDEALAAGNAKHRFLATMSHEMRTPLSAVLGMNELLLGTDLDDTQRGYAERASLSGSILQDLIADILDFSKIEAGAADLDLRQFDLHTLVASSVTVVSFAAESKKLPVVTQIADDCPRFVVGDATRVRQVLVNLLANAVKFTARGEVRIAAKRGSAEGRVCFEVVDTGIGISAEQLPRLFDPFTQADESTSRAYGGTGLGLSICQMLVVTMGGEIEVQSTPGQGSRFSFEISLADTAPPADYLETQGDTAGQHHREGLRVLVAEDNEALQLLSTRLVTKLGHAVDVVGTGSAAVAAVRASDYDVILMDVHMPYVDGFEATRQIRSAGSSVHQPRIIALTASATVRDREACFAAGMDDYVSKPFTSRDLQRAFAQSGALTAPLRPVVADPLGIALDELEPETKAEIMRAFLSRSASDLSMLEKAFESADVEQIRFVAHRMKGSSLMVGANTLAEWCLRIEKAADAPDIDIALLVAVRESRQSTVREIVRLGLADG